MVYLLNKVIHIVELWSFLLCLQCASGALSPLEGRFIDPNHPECPRTVLDIGTVVQVQLSFANGGDKCNWVTDSRWSLEAEIYDDDIVANFSSLGKYLAIVSRNMW